MRPSIGVVPVIVCLVLAVALGAWGWDERDASRARARSERDARAAREELIFFDDDTGFDLRWMDACGRLLVVSALTPPSTFAETPGGTTLAVSGDDLARELIDIIDARPEAGVPALESSEVQTALGRMRTELADAIDRSDDPLAEPQVAAAAADLDAVLFDVC